MTRIQQRPTEDRTYYTGPSAAGLAWLAAALIALLFALAPLSARGQNLVRFLGTPGETDVCIVFTDGAATAVDFAAEAQPGLYTFPDSAIQAAGLAAATDLAVRVYVGVDAASVDPATDDNLWAATIGPIHWSGTATYTEATRAANVLLASSTTGSPGANTVHQALQWLRAAFVSSGKFSVPALENGPAGEGGGVIIPVNQVPVPASRTFVLKSTTSGLVGESRRNLSEGDEQIFAWDFANDLPTNGRLASVEAITIIAGTPGGVTFAATATDPGVDRTQGKVTITAVTAGTYTVRMTVTYQSAQGGGTKSGDGILIVTD